MLATPDSHAEQQRSGTWSTIRYCRATRRPCLVIYPDGTYEHADFSPVPDVAPPWRVMT
jgi:hypothetical protein